MTYELAKKLKDAGFPQPNVDEKAKGDWVSDGGIVIWDRNRDEDDMDFIYIPTLSELIEACGDRFLQLNKVYVGKIEWFATGIISEGRINTDRSLNGEFESTPEIAVANLWLELNSK